MSRRDYRFVVKHNKKWALPRQGLPLSWHINNFSNTYGRRLRRIALEVNARFSNAEKHIHKKCPLEPLPTMRFSGRRRNFCEYLYLPESICRTNLHPNY